MRPISHTLRGVLRPLPGSNSFIHDNPGVFGRGAASTPGYKLKSLRDKDVGEQPFYRNFGDLLGVSKKTALLVKAVGRSGGRAGGWGNGGCCGGSQGFGYSRGSIGSRKIPAMMALSPAMWRIVTRILPWTCQL